MLLPLQAHYVQGERFFAQSQAKLPLRKRLWQQVVRAKIRLQGDVLKTMRGLDAGLPSLAGEVQSGDIANVEAQAARRYWQHLFPGQDFRRDRDSPGENQMLNYGYAVLRAITARAACSVGLHPSLGLHHRNRYNAFCLADDLMEPFRAAVDLVVCRTVDEQGADVQLSQETRHRILDSLYRRWQVSGESRSLFEATQMLASSLMENYLGRRMPLRLPTTLETTDALPTS
jgi:CRISPR-associated protein Cas1